MVFVASCVVFVAFIPLKAVLFFLSLDSGNESRIQFHRRLIDRRCCRNLCIRDRMQAREVSCFRATLAWTDAGPD